VLLGNPGDEPARALGTALTEAGIASEYVGPSHVRIKAGPTTAPVGSILSVVFSMSNVADVRIEQETIEDVVKAVYAGTLDLDRAG
jgi:hypothetical protein